MQPSLLSFSRCSYGNTLFSNISESYVQWMIEAILSNLSGILAGVGTALFSVGLTNHLRDFREKQVAFKAVVDELKENAARIQSNLNAAQGGRVKVIPFPFSDDSYKSLQLRGLTYQMPSDLRGNLSQLYAFLNNLNTLTGAKHPIRDPQRLHEDLVETRDDEIPTIMKNLEIYIEENNLDGGYLVYLKSKLLGWF